MSKSLFSAFFLFITIGVIAQFPAGLNMNSVPSSALDKYGISRDDLASYSMLAKGRAESSNEVAKEKKVIVEDSVFTAPDNVVKKEPKAADKLYGESFFDNNNLKVYKSATHIRASNDYVLGIGDELSVSIWGYSEHNGLYQVSEDGAINVKLIGKIYVKGLKYSQAKKVVKNRFGKVYDLKNSQFSLELTHSKVVRVNIVGEVNVPGTYSVSSLNSAFNVIAVAGGVSDKGSLRSILVIREGKLVKVLDVYKFLLSDKSKEDFSLKENDYVVIGKRQNVVELSGAIKSEGKFELLKDEGLKELLIYSGGFQKGAYRKAIEVLTYRNNERVLINVSLDSLINNKKKLILLNGDHVVVNRNSTELRNYVNLTGEFKVPGRFEYIKGDKLLDLINRANGVKHDAYLNKGYIMRLTPELTYDYLPFNYLNVVKNPNGSENYLLKEFDEIHISSKKEFVDSFVVKINGAVRNPLTVDYIENFTLGDLLLMSGGFKPGADNSKIEISRISNFGDSSKIGEPTKVEVTTVSVDINDAFNSKIELKPMDIVSVRMTPDFEDQMEVFLQGEVVYPGAYSMIRKDESLKELIERAGGLTDWASLEGARIFRPGVGYLVLDLGRLIKGDNDYNYVLREGDRVSIPKSSNIVTLSGEIEYGGLDSSAFVHTPYIKGRRAKYYINKFGAGFTKDAKRSKTFVITPGGRVKRTKNFGLFKIYPKVKNGDRVIVSKKPKKEKPVEKEPVDWNRAIENTTIKLTGLLTLYVLVNNVFQ